MAFPKARDDRIVDSCKVNSLLFLLDDVAEDMSLDEGKVYYERMIAIAKGKIPPKIDAPVERITYDVWQSLRETDGKLADDVLNGAILCLKAQVHPRRLACTDIGKLLEYRAEEGGVAFVAALMCYSMGLHVPEADLQSIDRIHKTYANLGMTVNDILSLDKEIRAWDDGHKEGASLLNMVIMLGEQLTMSIPATKRILWNICREWEIEHAQNVFARLTDRSGCSDELKDYIQGLEYILGGNEAWSWTTGRYHKRD
ncbi:hypothetical protein LTR17_010882 [Elasticomyces elasticus]|nr:hypothetical protein LTR17_010882 [Elasticomyces elasticus]